MGSKCFYIQKNKKYSDYPGRQKNSKSSHQNKQKFQQQKPRYSIDCFVLFSNLLHTIATSLQKYLFHVCMYAWHHLNVYNLFQVYKDPQTEQASSPDKPCQPYLEHCHSRGKPPSNTQRKHTSETAKCLRSR